MKTRARLVAALVLVAGTLTGCGYTTSSLHPTEISTVAIPIFQSSEFRRGLEYELTRELVNLVELRTPYKVTSQERADSLLTGRVLGLQQTVVTEDEDDVTTEAQVTLQVAYEWKDLRTGKVIRSGRPHYAWYYATSEAQTLRSAQTTAIRRLAEAIVEDMEEDW